MAENSSGLPFYFRTKCLLSLKHGNDELSPFFFNVVWMITLEKSDTAKFYPNLEGKKKLMRSC